jgi:diguanylate cyclase (GGDEF)-like protein
MVLGWALPDAPIRWHELNSRPLYRASTREVCGTVTSIIDITERKMLTDEAFHRASHDPLTGLGNRDELLTKVKSVMQRKVRTGDEVAIAFIDIDNFKAINDKYGHQAGDETLQHIATRIARAVRSGDIVARVGGDEIAVLLDQVAGLPGALRAAEKIRAAVCMPVQLNDCMFTPTVSIGVSLLDHYEELELGLSRADTAMYSAKHSGRNAVVGMDAIGSCMPIGTDDGE